MSEKCNPMARCVIRRVEADELDEVQIARGWPRGNYIWVLLSTGEVVAELTQAEVASSPLSLSEIYRFVRLALVGK